MGALVDLFTSFEGLLSLAVIVFIIGMAVYCTYMFISKMNSEGIEEDKKNSLIKGQ